MPASSEYCNWIVHAQCIIEKFECKNSFMYVSANRDLGMESTY